MASAEEQLRKAQEEIARLRKAAKKKRAAKNEWKPSFPGHHRGY